VISDDPPWPTSKLAAPAHHREQLTTVGGGRRRLLRSVHDELEWLFTLSGIRISLLAAAACSLPADESGASAPYRRTNNA